MRIKTWLTLASRDSGNLGCLVFQADEHSFGADWIAASFKAKSYVKEVQDAGEGGILIEPAKENALVATYYPPSSSGEDDKSWEIEFDQTLSADHRDRQHDSEYLLLNFFDYLAINRTRSIQTSASRGELETKNVSTKALENDAHLMRCKITEFIFYSLRSAG